MNSASTNTGSVQPWVQHHFHQKVQTHVLLEAQSCMQQQPHLSTHHFHPRDLDGTMVQQCHGDYKEQEKRSKVRDRAKHDGVDPNAETVTT